MKFQPEYRGWNFLKIRSTRLSLSFQLFSCISWIALRARGDFSIPRGNILETWTLSARLVKKINRCRIFHFLKLNGAQNCVKFRASQAMTREFTADPSRLCKFLTPSRPRWLLRGSVSSVPGYFKRGRISNGSGSWKTRSSLANKLAAFGIITCSNNNASWIKNVLPFREPFRIAKIFPLN